MDGKRIALAAAAALLALALWLAWLWQPERQLRRHTAGLLGSIERRNWSRVQDQFADNYSDRWGHDKPFVLASLREAFGSFIFLQVEHEIVTLDAATGRVTLRVKMSGQGGPIAQYVMAKINGLSEPFTFAWRKGGHPWDWQLIGVDHPSLDPDAEPNF